MAERSSGLRKDLRDLHRVDYEISRHQPQESIVHEIVE